VRAVPARMRRAEERSDMKPRISVLTLGVGDLEKAVEFYRDGLGFPTEGIVGEEFEHGAVAFFDLASGLKLGLWARADIARGRRRDGASPCRRREDHQDRSGNVLWRICRLFPGSRWASLGGCLESPPSAGRLNRRLACQGLAAEPRIHASTATYVARFAGHRTMH